MNGFYWFKFYLFIFFIQLQATPGLSQVTVSVNNVPHLHAIGSAKEKANIYHHCFIFTSSFFHYCTTAVVELSDPWHEMVMNGNSNQKQICFPFTVAETLSQECSGVAVCLPQCCVESSTHIPIHVNMLFAFFFTKPSPEFSKACQTSLCKRLAKWKDYKIPIALFQKNRSTHNWGY